MRQKSVQPIGEYPGNGRLDSSARKEKDIRLGAENFDFFNLKKTLNGLSPSQKSVIAGNCPVRMNLDASMKRLGFKKIARNYPI